MSLRHEEQFREMDRRLPRSWFWLRVLMVFAALPAVVFGLAWIDRASGEGKTVTGTVVRVAAVSAKHIPGAQTMSTVELPDSTRTTCALGAAIVGMKVPVTVDRSRLLGRTIISC